MVGKFYVCLIFVALTIKPAIGWAFICSRVPDENDQESGASLSWFTRALTYSLYEKGTNDIPGDTEFDELRDSFQVWQNNVATNANGNCIPDDYKTDLIFNEAANLSTNNKVGYDFLNPNNNENLLIFHDISWPHTGNSGIILALTTNTYNALTGEIFDSDIEFNSENFKFTASSDVAQTDLKNTAVHEIGHFLGIAHTPIKAATMYEQAVVGETKKRDLDCDDAQATHFKYPENAENGYCSPTAECGFCAPPGILSSTVEITVTDSNPDSTTGCQCTSVEAPLLGIAWLGLLLRRRRKI